MLVTLVRSEVLSLGSDFSGPLQHTKLELIRKQERRSEVRKSTFWKKIILVSDCFMKLKHRVEIHYSDVDEFRSKPMSWPF